MIVILPLNIFLQTVCYFFFCNSKCILPTTQKEAKYITLHRISKNSNRMYCQWVMAYICKGSEFFAKRRKDSEPHLEEFLCCWKLVCLLPFSPSLHWGNKTRTNHGQTTHIQRTNPQQRGAGLPEVDSWPSRSAALSRGKWKVCETGNR